MPSERLIRLCSDGSIITEAEYVERYKAELARREAHWQSIWTPYMPQFR